MREVWRGLSARALMAGEAPAADKGLTRKIDGLTLTRSACLHVQAQHACCSDPDKVSWPACQHAARLLQ